MFTPLYSNETKFQQGDSPKFNEKPMRKMVEVSSVPTCESSDFFPNLILRHPFTQMGKIVSNFGKGIPKYFRI